MSLPTPRHKPMSKWVKDQTAEFQWSAEAGILDLFSRTGQAATKPSPSHHTSDTREQGQPHNPFFAFSVNPHRCGCLFWSARNSPDWLSCPVHTGIKERRAFFWSLLKNCENSLLGTDFSFTRWVLEIQSGDSSQQCECTWYHWTIHLKTVKTVNFMWCVF